MAGDPKGEYYRRVSRFHSDINELLKAKPQVNARAYLDVYSQLLGQAEAVFGSAPPLPAVDAMRIDETKGLEAVMSLKPYVGQLLSWAHDEAGMGGFA